MSLVSLFATSFGLAFSGALVPGPLLTVTIDASLRRGFIAGPLLILGHGVLELNLVIAMVLGLNEIAMVPGVKEGIGLVGGAYLLWMAYGILKDVGRIEIDFSQIGNKGKVTGLVMKGAAVSFANPYFTIWWATMGLTYVTMALDKGVWGLAVFYTGHVLADFAWYSIVSYIIVTGRRVFNLKIYRTVLGVCGVFLAGLGGYFLFTGMTFFIIL